jgi:hypothetical protein
MQLMISLVRTLPDALLSPDALEEAVHVGDSPSGKPPHLRLAHPGRPALAGSLPDLVRVASSDARVPSRSIAHQREHL